MGESAIRRVRMCRPGRRRPHRPTSGRRWTAAGAITVLAAGVLAAAAPTSASSWQGWTPIGGALTSGADAASWGGGRLDVFARGPDAALYHKASDPKVDGGTWSGWQRLGGQLTSDPAAVSSRPGRYDVFVRGPGSGLFQLTYAAGWHTWTYLGGPFLGSPDVASWGNGRLDVVIRGTDNQLRHRAYNGTAWLPWENLGGYVTADPAAVSWGTGRFDTFVRGPGNGLWHRYWNGRWSGWVAMGGQLGSGLDAASDGPGRLDFVVQSLDHAVYQRSWRGYWTGWTRMGETATSDPTVTSAAPGHLDAFVRGPDGQAWHDPTGTPPTPPPPTGDPRTIGRQMLSQYGWGNATQWTCLDQLWTRESNWDPLAENSSSGAYGIPQALPADKMAAAGADWRTNPVTQIRWGLDYIQAVYASPCAAWQHEVTFGWYFAS